MPLGWGGLFTCSHHNRTNLEFGSKVGVAIPSNQPPYPALRLVVDRMNSPSHVIDAKQLGRDFEKVNLGKLRQAASDRLNTRARERESGLDISLSWA